MIKSIKMKNCATYSEEGISIENCQKVNFIYGANGSGKSTISKFLYNQNNEEYSCCEIEMSDNAETEILVYNKDFKTRNIVENIDGVFTLGEATIEDINRLNNMKEKYEAQRQEHQTQKNALEVKEKERDSLDEKFRDIVWEEILKKNEKDFMEAFTGYRSNKEKFHKLVLEKYREYNELTKKDLISTRDNLIARANVLFSTDLKTCEPINVSFADKILHAQQIETDQVWSEIVVGNKDLPISKLINSLQNADWVNKGRSFLRGSKTCTVG